jgi:CubicO group peptidase (beta-lactamase class C family)
MKRAVQGYGDDGEPIDQPGDQRSYYHWSGTGQMFSSPRDMALFLAANLGELPTQPTLHEAMALAQRRVVNISERNLLGRSIADPAPIKSARNCSNQSRKHHVERQSSRL